MPKPLTGLVVIDLTHMLSGPFCTMLLADPGARMIKVEPLHGEGTRSLLAKDPKNSRHGMGAYFLTLNRNKESVVIDLKKPEGRSLFYELIKQADAVVDQFRPRCSQAPRRRLGNAGPTQSAHHHLLGNRFRRDRTG